MSLSDRLMITVAEVKSYLRINNDAEDAFLEDLIKIAIEQVDSYLQNDFTKENEETGEIENVDLPLSLKLACLKMIATWYEIRTTDIQSHTVNGFSVSVGEIPINAEKLLHPYRKFVGL